MVILSLNLHLIGFSLEKRCCITSMHVVVLWQSIDISGNINATIDQTILIFEMYKNVIAA